MIVEARLRENDFKKPSRRSNARIEKRPFVPRIINPVKIKDAVICASDQSLRDCRSIIQTEMPWVNCQVIASPQALSASRMADPAAIIMDDVALSLTDTDKLRESNRDIIIVLLSYIGLIQHSPPSVALGKYPYTAKADLVFAVDRGDFAPARIITSVVRAAEDHLNIARHPDISRFIVLIVDDEPSWPSQFLPILYRIIGQRADVKITRTYEEAVGFMFGVEHKSQIDGSHHGTGYGDQVICLITDVYFPRDGEITSAAGLELIELTIRCFARIPIIIASKAQEARELADRGFVLPKGDAGSLEMLEGYIRDRTGIGDFVIHDDDGREIHRSKNIHELYSLIQKAKGRNPESVKLRSLLEAYGAKDMFSTWFYMHGMRQLADELRPQKHSGEKMVSVLAEALGNEIWKMSQIPLVIDNEEINDLGELSRAVGVCSLNRIEDLSHNDILSSWLDQRGFSELAETLRPLHGKGPELREKIIALIEEWTRSHERRGLRPGDSPLGTYRK